MPELKKYYEWLKEVDSIALQSSMENLGNAYDRYYSKQGKQPRFKSKKNLVQSYRTKNSNNNFETRKLQKSIVYGDYVDLGTVTTTKNAEDPLSIDVIFSDSYKLTTIDTVQYTITSNSTDFYLSNTTNFIVRYDSNKGLYYFTIPITNTANYV